MNSDALMLMWHRCNVLSVTAELSVHDTLSLCPPYGVYCQYTVRCLNAHNTVPAATIRYVVSMPTIHYQQSVHGTLSLCP